MRRSILLAIVGVTVMLAGLAATAQARDERTAMVAQMTHSKHVLAFFANPNHLWLSAPARDKCWQVPWQKSCRIARSLIELHTARKATLERRLDATDPIISRLNRGLRGTPMEGLGRVLRDVGRAEDVSPFFMAAVAGTESSFGAAGCSNNPRNVWGLANCDGRWYVPYFNTWDEAIRFYADFLSDRWPSATSPFHFSGYAACDACWGRKTAYWMSSRFGVSAYTKYPG